jgi:Do/DeqQ family serine protease
VISALPAALSAILAAAPSPARRTPLVAAVERTKGAVVNINAQEVVKGGGDQFNLFFGLMRGRDEVRTSLGSGFVFDEHGYVLTNYHVVARGSRIQVSFDDGSDYTAKVVGTDPGGDLAVLKLEGKKKFAAAPLGKSEDLMLGEPTIAIGNPFGLNQSVSTGVVSALHRTVRAENHSYYDFIQTDASINPGNSGGPLLNADGNVIGVCSAIYANAQGIGFAIPIDRALRVARELQRAGELADSFWGFEAESLDAEGAKALGARAGALVTTIEDGSPADKAKLRRGDAIVEIDKSPVRDADELRFLLRDVPLGTPVTLALMRGKERLEVRLKAEPLTAERAQAMFEARSGLALIEMTPAQARDAGYKTDRSLLAVKSVERGSAASRVGLRSGDLVISVNSAEIQHLKEFRKALSQARKSGKAVLLIQRGYQLQEFAFDLG